MPFGDDEQPLPARPAGVTGLPARQVQLIKYHNRSAPLAPNDQEVMLDLRGIASAADREPLDLVAVIDTSGSMADGAKLDKAKSALSFVIRKLTDRDRLCIVRFAHQAARLCPLRCATEAAQADLEALVGGLEAGGGTNIQAGLETGLGVVSARRATSGRAASVMLMSDGDENSGDARAVEPGGVPVHTFGFGSDHDPMLLGAVATKSLGGVFNYVAEGDSPTNLTETFSQILGGLLTIIAQDLELTVTPLPGEATIDKPMDAGSYPVIPAAAAAGSSPVTVRFGTLYSAEERKVVVELALSDRTAARPYRAHVAQVQYRFTFQGQQVTSDPDRITIRRGRGSAAAGEAPPPQVGAEVARRRHAGSIRAAMEEAESDRLEGARGILAEALRALERVAGDPVPVVEMLRKELRRLLELFKTKDAYRGQGRPYAVASLGSHGRQRFAARGEARDVRLFATRRMDTYLEQAKRPDEKPPSADEDVIEEPAGAGAGRRGEVDGVSVALRVLTAVLGLLSFSIMASARTSGWDGGDRYETYRYAVGVNVVVCFFSVVQAIAEIRRRLLPPRSTPRRRSTPIHCIINLFLDQAKQTKPSAVYSLMHIQLPPRLAHSPATPPPPPLLANHQLLHSLQVLAYLLMSASSAAASRNHLWAARFGEDQFSRKVSIAVWFAFLGFLALSANALISMANLFARM